MTTLQQMSDQKTAQNTIQLNVTKWTFMLCDALRQNYIDYSIRSILRNGDANSDYNKARLEDLRNGHCGEVDFIFESGRKYHKIWHVDGSGHRSCHAFIDKKTGEVYKPASYKAPAKGVRFNLSIIKEREYLLNPANCDWAGGYLYRNSTYFCS
tara:strand:+ start:432 stop:893 length:462 start_codon:yes stop_codon:yes gene_type:complete